MFVKIPTIRHLFGSPLCVFDIVTSGNDPSKHEILEVCFAISDDFLELYKTQPYYLKLIPKFPEDANKNLEKIDDCLKNGTDPYLATDIFDMWIKNLQLDNKKLSLVGYNTHTKLNFLKEWLGPTCLEENFEKNVRDLLPSALFVQDQSHFRHVDQFTWNPTLADLSNSLGVRNEMKGNALHNAKTILELYRRLIGKCI